jgi:hypothetical protein
MRSSTQEASSPSTRDAFQGSSHALSSSPLDPGPKSYTMPRIPRASVRCTRCGARKGCCWPEPHDTRGRFIFGLPCARLPHFSSGAVRRAEIAPDRGWCMRRTFYLLAAIAMLLTSTARAQLPALFLYGGTNHKTFLGCLNCDKYGSAAVCNKYGNFGSKYNSDSIWNRYGTFGSKYSSDSPWNKYASSTPIIVDQSGRSYGHLSANRYHSNRTRIEVFVQLADYLAEQDDLDKARDLFCGD